MANRPKKVLTIAGSDCSGGAGLQADLKTFQERGVYGMTAVTCLVAMEPATWHHIVKPVDMEMIQTQIKTILDGINSVDALKTGMLPTADIIKQVGLMLKNCGVKHIVIDPVMVCKGAGQPLFPENTAAMIKYLLPVADVVTPNTFEAEQLAGVPEIKTLDDVFEAAIKIQSLGAKNVIIKAARVFKGKAINVLFDGKALYKYEMDKVRTKWTHGAGCSFSACVTAELAKKAKVLEAFQTATDFVNEGLKKSFPLNGFVGPIWHKAYAEAQA
ncbi:MAG: bifunctional hydroxymethylpyrimidine kinase/phosphomethylpyrimidine kinase [Victivallales bacterium]|nr:bifunctional hydroxymethylpyrimidine kinase/phosphomethylpyrimidine kinase [Victivallales bacterium]